MPYVKGSYSNGSPNRKEKEENDPGDTDSTYKGTNILHFRPTEEELDVIVEGDLGNDHIDELEYRTSHMKEMDKKMADSLSLPQKFNRYDNWDRHMQSMRDRDDKKRTEREERKATKDVKKKKKGDAKLKDINE